MWLFRDCPSFLAGSRMLRTPLAVRSLRIAGEGASGFMRGVGFEGLPFRFRAIARLRTELCTKITFFVCRSKYFGHYLFVFRQIVGVAPIRPTPFRRAHLRCRGSERLFPAVGGDLLLLSPPHGGNPSVGGVLWGGEVVDQRPSPASRSVSPVSSSSKIRARSAPEGELGVWITSRSTPSNPRNTMP